MERRQCLNGLCADHVVLVIQQALQQRHDLCVGGARRCVETHNGVERGRGREFDDSPRVLSSVGSIALPHCARATVPCHTFPTCSCPPP